MGKNLIKTTGFRFSDPDLLHKLNIIAAIHKRRRNQEVEWALTQYVKNYEELHGEIQLKPPEQTQQQEQASIDQKQNQLITNTKEHINNSNDKKIRPPKGSLI